MGLRYFANAPATTLSSSVSSAATILPLTSTAGLPIQYPFILIVDRAGPSEEVVLVTDVSGLNATVTRGYDSTTAFSHSIGAPVEHGISAIDAREANAHANATSGVHGLAGSPMGTSDVQVVTNKDLSSVTNTFPDSLATDTEVASVVSAHAGLLNTHGVSGNIVGTASSQTLTNKTINLASNTLTGTKAQFDAALSDNEFATLIGIETLTNKNLSSSSNTFPGDIALIGEIKMWPTTSAPTKYLLCDGTAVSRTTYATLFTLIGTTYGVGDGSTTFNLPNLKGRVAAGRDAAQTEFDTIGETGGAKTHTLTTAEIPAHTHSYTAPVLFGTDGSGASQATTTGGSVTGSTGGGGAHNNLQPYIVLNYIIRAL